MSSLLSVALISQFKLKQYAVRPLHSGQCRNGPSADAGTLAGSVRCPFNQDTPGFSTQRTLQKWTAAIFKFRIFSFAFCIWSTSQAATSRCRLTPHKKPNATPYGRPSTIKNSLNEDGARGRTAVTEWNEFAVLAFFWFLFWGNAKKGTKTRSNKQKIKILSRKNQK